MLTSTGKIIPSASFWVLALNCLQKSMMLTPCGPSAVPTGGAGVALPAGNCNLMVVCSFFGGMFPLPQNLVLSGGLILGATTSKTAGLKTGHLQIRSAQLFHAGEIEFHRRRAPENRDGNLEATVVVVDVLDCAVEIRKRAVDDADLLVALVDDLRFRAVLRRVHAVDYGVDFRLRKRRRRGG